MSGKQTKTTTTTTNNWELTQYEEQRKPQEVILDDTMVAVSHTLNQDFKCPICLELMKNTMAAKECLHRFCQVSYYK